MLDVLDPIVIALQQCQKNSMYSSSSLGYFQNLTTKGTQFKECYNELFSRYKKKKKITHLMDNSRRWHFH